MEKLISRNCIVFDIPATSKNDVLLTLVKQLKEAGKITDVEKFYEDVLAREAICPTAIGFDMGMPHGKTENVISPAVCFGRLSAPVLWNEESGEMANIVIMIAVPKTEESNIHIKILSSLSRQLMHEEFRDKLLNSSADEVFELLDKTLEA